MGPSIKYVTLDGEGVRESVTVCDRGRVQEHVTSHLNFFHTYETWNWKWWLTFCCNGGILTEGEWTKTTSDKTFQTKNPGQNPKTKTLRTSERLCTGGFCPGFCTTKHRGVRDVWRTLGWVPRGVTKQFIILSVGCDKGVKFGQK